MTVDSGPGTVFKANGDPAMTFKFEHLEVWKMTLEYIDQMYELAEELLRHEDFNLKSQLTRAAT